MNKMLKISESVLLGVVLPIGFSALVGWAMWEILTNKEEYHQFFRILCLPLFFMIPLFLLTKIINCIDYIGNNYMKW